MINFHESKKSGFMFNITLPDGSVREFDSPISGFQLAESISSSLGKAAIIMEVNGEQKDLSTLIECDASIRIITAKDPESLEILRHDAAHLLAEAVKELYPEAQITIGPSIENGFYYDIAPKTQLTNEDLVKIEACMSEIAKRDEKIIREEWDRDQVIEFFKSIGEHYKAEIIREIPGGEKITLYRQGNFIDLCRGPHGPSTSKIKYFKLMKLAGAYWRGDSRNEMLQRIYGTVWHTKEDLDNYLHMLQEAEKRDHRKLGRELDLFHLQEEAQGMIFWHPNGWTLYRIIENYIRKKREANNYIEVKTPILVDSALWKASGHWDKFRENMFISDVDDKHMAMKPMNCPCHVQIFRQGIKSYRDLPIRMAEFGSCHRNEASGALHGIMRVRGFVQDDAHIFCTEDQINKETIAFCGLLKEVYKDFGFTELKVKFSTRPEVRAGTDEVWDKAENALLSATEASGLEYEINPGEGAFYGPKLEFILRDAIGRDWQCGTLQVDFILPERLDASYIDHHGEKKRPVMLHRAIIGTFERFIGILIEQYAGKFPLWLAPVQVAVTTITNDLDDHGLMVYERLKSSGVRVIFDNSAEKIGYKIRALSEKKIPIIATIGKNERENGNITIRRLGSQEQETISVEELIRIALQ